MEFLRVFGGFGRFWGVLEGLGGFLVCFCGVLGDCFGFSEVFKDF